MKTILSGKLQRAMVYIHVSSQLQNTKVKLYYYSLCFLCYLQVNMEKTSPLPFGSTDGFLCCTREILDFQDFNLRFYGWGGGVCIHCYFKNNFLYVFSYGSIGSCLCWLKAETTDFSVIKKEKIRLCCFLSLNLFDTYQLMHNMNLLYAATFYAESLMQNFSFLSSRSRMESLLDCKK